MSSWGISLIQGGTDVSARLVGEVRIEALRGAARVCGYSVRLAGVSRAELEGQVVTIDLHTGGSWVRRFTGRVLRATIDRTTGIFDVMCADSLKQQANASDLATLLTLCAPGDGVWSEHVFGARTTGWQQVQDIASTTWGTVQCSASDVPEWVSWQAKTTPDVTFSKYVRGTLSEDDVDYDTIVNEYHLTWQWRSWRLWERGHKVQWTWPYTWCERFLPAETGELFMQNVCELPSTEDVSAFDGQAGWSIRRSQSLGAAGPDGLGFSYTGLPTTGYQDCGDGPIYWNLFPEWANWVTHFAVTMSRRGAQTVARTWDITVTAPQSVARYGLRAAEDQASGEQEYDTSAWLAGQGSPAPAAIEGVTMVDNGLGDQYADLLDDTACALGLAAFTRSKAMAIRAAHRRAVRWEEPLALSVEIASTVRLVQTGHCDIKGPVQRIIDTITLPSGPALTQIELGISRSTTTPQDDSEWVWPDPPAALPTHTAPASTTTLDTHIGWYPDAPEWDDEDMEGWRTNRTFMVEYRPLPLPDPDPLKYTVGFNFSLPDIEAEMTDEVTATVTETFEISIPHDTLTGGS